jgi:large subunit ribosomal protein L4
MKAPLFDTSGKSTGTVDLEASHFGVEPNMGLIHRILILQQANGRIAIAHTKHRGEVAGSTRKMFKQKGTGSARMGDRRSPMRRGGGVVFGPRNTQNWTVSMNAQERRLSLLSLLSIKAKDNNVKVISAFSSDAVKTKGMKATIATMDAKKPLIAITHAEKDAVLGAWNIPEVKIVNVEYLNPHSLLKYKDLVFTEASLKHLYEHFAK